MEDTEAWLEKNHLKRLTIIQERKNWQELNFMHLQSTITVEEKLQPKQHMPHVTELLKQRARGYKRSTTNIIEYRKENINDMKQESEVILKSWNGNYAEYSS